MMKQQPDKLFRDKLESYSRPAPTRAWDKIEASLDKKSNKGLWLKAAASLLLAVATAYTLWHVYTPSARQQEPRLTEELPAPSVQHPASHAADSSRQIPLALPQQTTPVAEANTPVAAAPPARKNNRTAPAAQSTAPATNHLANHETTVSITGTSATETTATPEAPAVPPAAETYTHTNTATTAVAATHTENKKTITLVYSAREADGYLDKKALAEATSDDAKPSTLKKLLKKAADLKSNQDPLGELRQRKNEILALNFRSEKQRGQNK